jgi:hypothetical protein
MNLSERRVMEKLASLGPELPAIQGEQDRQTE